MSVNLQNVDPVFKMVPSQKPFFIIWRIEQLKLVPVPKPQWGTFYKGDAYILYSAREMHNSSALDQHIHFWIGSDCSQDEAGTAAFKTVELDDMLGGTPIQHREVEGNESKEFHSYFKKGIRYNDGGVKSGFNHIDRDHFQAKLYHVKGKRRVRCTQMPLDWVSFNSGDVFISDQGRCIFVWNGSESSRFERIKALDIARGLKDERKAADLLIIEEGEEINLVEPHRSSWEAGGTLSLVQRVVAGGRVAGDDQEFERIAASQVKLYRCTDEGGTLRIIEVSEGPLHYNMLDSSDVFIVDNGNAGVWVWCGKASNNNEKRAAMNNAVSFVEKLGRHSKTVQVTKVNELCENTTFKQLFQGWPAPKYSGKSTNNNCNRGVAKTIQTKFDACTMHQNNRMAAETKMIDDGSGVVKIWRVESMELVAVDTALYGQFYGGDSYLLLYDYQVNSSATHQYIIYYWQGRKSSADERGAVALHATRLDDELGGSPVQVRVVQGKEPPHFLSIFKGRLVVFDGGRVGWNKEDKAQSIGDTYLLRVHGTTALNTKAEQVPTSASSLNSNDAFLLVSRQQIFIWCGKGTTGDEREMAKSLAKNLSRRDYILLSEGQETQAFWSLLGGKAPYMSDKRLQAAQPDHPPRLFQCSNDKGYFYVEECYDFTQDDLIEDDVMLLDTWDEIYLWIGRGANATEKQAALRTAREYIDTDPSQARDCDTPIYTVKQGFEPPTFTGFFPNWDLNLWNNAMTYDEMKQKFSDEKHFAPQLADKVDFGNGANLSFADYVKYDYETLRNNPPDNLRGDEKECHLTEEEFLKVFGMNYATFSTLPSWKQTLKKKQVGLF